MMTAEIIWDRDHGPENEGFCVRLSRGGDSQDEDVSLFAVTSDEARAEVMRGWPGVEITRCDDEPRGRGGGIMTTKLEPHEVAGLDPATLTGMIQRQQGLCAYCAQVVEQCRIKEGRAAARVEQAWLGQFCTGKRRCDGR